MNVKSVEKSESSTATLVLEVESSQFQSALDKVYRQVKNDIYVPGFRKGKAPRKIVERMYGANIFHEDAIELLFPDLWTEAAETAELHVVSTPSISNYQVDADTGMLTITVETGLYPEVTLGQYKELEAEKPSSDVTEEEVDAEIQKLVDRNSTVETVERAAEMGDTVVIDYDGYMNGEAFEGGSGDKHNLKLGSGTFIPGFEEQLVGVSAGDEIEVNVTFPEDYGAEELAGQPAVFKVKVRDVKETTAPELDDEFAKDVSETADTMEELRKEQREKLQKEKSESADNAFQNAVIQKAIDNMTAVIPNVMIEEQLDSMMQQYSASMEESGFSIEQYAQMMGTTVENLRESYRPNALSQIQYSLLLEKVAKVEEITIPEEDIEEAYQKMAEEYNMEIDRVKEYIPSEEMIQEQKNQKAMNLIVESAVAVPPQETAEEEETSPAESDVSMGSPSGNDVESESKEDVEMEITETAVEEEIGETAREGIETTEDIKEKDGEKIEEE